MHTLHTAELTLAQAQIPLWIADLNLRYANLDYLFYACALTPLLWPRARLEISMYKDDDLLPPGDYAELISRVPIGVKEQLGECATELSPLNGSSNFSLLLPEIVSLIAYSLPPDELLRTALLIPEINRACQQPGLLRALELAYSLPECSSLISLSNLYSLSYVTPGNYLEYNTPSQVLIHCCETDDAELFSRLHVRECPYREVAALSELLGAQKMLASLSERGEPLSTGSPSGESALYATSDTPARAEPIGASSCHRDIKMSLRGCEHTPSSECAYALSIGASSCHRDIKMSLRECAYALSPWLLVRTPQGHLLSPNALAANLRERIICSGVEWSPLAQRLRVSYSALHNSLDLALQEAAEGADDVLVGGDLCDKWISRLVVNHSARVGCLKILEIALGERLCLRENRTSRFLERISSYSIGSTTTYEEIEEAIHSWATVQ